MITGVSGQLGCQYARTFLSKGAHVAGIDIELSQKTHALIEEYPSKFRYFNCDVTSESSLRDILAKLKREVGVPSVLVNNAAIDSPPNAPLKGTGPLNSYPNELWDKIMEVNVKGTYLPSKIFGTEMANCSKGSIINISSIYGVVSPDQSIYEYRRTRGETFYKPIAYSVSKSAIINLTRYLSTYWAKDNVRVNTLIIGGVFNEQDSDFLENYCKKIPIGRMANEDEYIGAIIFLASKASSYMTGSQLVIDGGWTAI